MRIVSIKLDGNGYKIIAAEKQIIFSGKRVHPNAHFPKGYKHSGTTTIFFDYKEGIVRRFAGSRHDEINVIDYKAALKHILSLTH